MNILEQLREADAGATKGAWVTEGATLVWSPEAHAVICGSSHLYPKSGTVEYQRPDYGDLEQPAANGRLIALARTHLPALLAVCDAAKEMRAATEAYVAEAELEPPHCDLEREQAARLREHNATVALDAALAVLTEETDDANL